MGRHKSVLKGTKDNVKCSFCKRVIQRRSLNTHWNNHQTQLPIHPPTPYNKRAIEIKPTSNIHNYFTTTIKTKQTAPPNNNDKDADDGDVGMKLPEPPSSIQRLIQPTVQPKIQEVFGQVSKELLDRKTLADGNQPG